MVTNNLKNYNNEDIISLIEGIQYGNITYNLNDLKAILAEVTSRKLDQKYIDLLAELIKKSLKGENAPADKPIRRQVTKADEPEDYEEDNEEEFEKFPVLNLLTAVYKVLGWLFLLLSIAVALVLSITMFKENITAIAGLFLGAVAVGTILMLVFYAAAESITLKLEIEKHLRKRG